MRGVEEERLSIETLAGDAGKRLPAIADLAAEELEAPQERDRVVQIARDRRGRALEHPAPEVRRYLVLAASHVHQRQVPEEMVPEPAQVRARLDGRRQARDPRIERRQLVERVGERVDAPGV